MRFTLKTLIAFVTIAAILAFCARCYLIRPIGIMHFNGTALLVGDRHEEARERFEKWLSDNGYERTGEPVRKFQRTQNIDFVNQLDGELSRYAILRITADHAQLDRKRYMLKHRWQSTPVSSAKRRKINDQFMQHVGEYHEWLSTVAETDEEWIFLP